jgi:hypothetical protein
MLLGQRLHQLATMDIMLEAAEVEQLLVLVILVAVKAELVDKVAAAMEELEALDIKLEQLILVAAEVLVLTMALMLLITQQMAVQEL